MQLLKSKLADYFLKFNSDSLVKSPGVELQLIFRVQCWIQEIKA